MTGPTPQRSDGEGRRQRSRRRRISQLLGAALAVTFVVAFLAFGGVEHGARAALHGLVVACLALAILLPSHTLASAGRLWRILAAAACLIVAATLGYLPLPAAVAALVAPGALERFPGWAAHTASLDAEETTEALTHLVLVAGAAVAVGAFGIAHWRRKVAERALLVLGTTLPIVALSHAFTNTTALFGRFPTWIQAPYKFYAPFVSQSHAGSALLLAWPLVLYEATNTDLLRGTRASYAALAVFMAFAMVVYHATGPLAVMGGVVFLLAWRRRWLPRPVLATAVPLGVLAVVGYDAYMDPGNTGNLHGRTAIWASTVDLIGDHWLLGAGAGTYGGAISPYRTDHDFVVWDHAHEEYLEWASETGLVGVVLAVVALWLVRPRKARDADRAWLVSAGAAAVMLHGLVDFPLRLPALAMAAAGLVAWRVTVHEDRTPTSPLAIRLALAVFLAANLGAAAWQLRGRSVDPASARLWATRTEEEQAASRLRSLAPWRPELALYDVARSVDRQDGDAARAGLAALVADHPEDPEALSRASLLLLKVKQPKEALGAAERAVHEGPWDWRMHVNLARVTTLVDPEHAPEAWHDAIEVGAPPSTFEEAWRVVPVGLYWVDAVQAGHTRQDAALGSFLQRKGDAEAAVLAFEEAAFDDPQALHPEYVDALVAVGDVDRAEAYLDRALARYGDDRDWVRRKARLREAEGRWEEASVVWMSLAHYDPKAALAAVQAAAKGGGPEAGLKVVLRLQADGTAIDVPILLERARLQAQAGLREACVRDLAASGLMDRPDTKARAQRAMQACRSAGIEPAPSTPGGG